MTTFEDTVVNIILILIDLLKLAVYTFIEHFLEFLLINFVLWDYKSRRNTDIEVV